MCNSPVSAFSKRGVISVAESQQFPAADISPPAAEPSQAGSQVVAGSVHPSGGDVAEGTAAPPAGVQPVAGTASESETHAAGYRRSSSRCPPDQELADLWLNHTPAEIGAMFGVTRTAVYRWLTLSRRRAPDVWKDLPARKPASSICPPPEVLADLCRTRTRGEIAVQYGVIPATVSSWCRKSRLSHPELWEEIPVRIPPDSCIGRFFNHTEAAALAELRQHFTMAEIADRYGVSRQAVSEWVLRSRLRYPDVWEGVVPKRPGLCPETAELVDLYKHSSREEIAEKYGVTVSTVDFWVRESRSCQPEAWSGCPSPTELRALRMRRRPPDDELAELDRTCSRKEMAAKYGVKTATVNNWVCRSRKQHPEAWSTEKLRKRRNRKA